jgi:hypothetical protein
MLPDDAFLRRLPKILYPEERLRLEALVYSADTIEASYQSIVSLTSRYGENITEIKRIERTQLFMLAWSIVDHLHACRQLLPSLGLNTQTATKFIEETESATILRNKMDHLNPQIGNLSKLKDTRPPLFGALTYIYMPMPKDNIPPKDGATILISAGTWSHGLNAQFALPAGLNLRLPVGEFHLQAFDQRIPIEKAALGLRDLIIEVNDVVEKVSREQIQNITKEKGIPVEKLSEKFAEGLVLFLAFKVPDSQT